MNIVFFSLALAALIQVLIPERGYEIKYLIPPSFLAWLFPAMIIGGELGMICGLIIGAAKFAAGGLRTAWLMALQVEPQSGYYWRAFVVEVMATPPILMGILNFL